MNRRLFATLAVLVTATFLSTIVPGCHKKKETVEPERTGAKAAFYHTKHILSFGPRPPQSSALKNTRDYITTELQKHGWTVSEQSFSKHVSVFVDDFRRNERIHFNEDVRFTNLIARFGSSETTPKGILAAHIDSKFYLDRDFLGADDAASAVGTILELARQLSSTPELASQLELVFFDGEEAYGQNISPSDGLYGSKHYALRWKGAEQKPSFGIVLDMIGHKNLKIRYPSDTPPSLEKSLLDAAQSAGEEARYTKALDQILDDHVPLNNAGIPSIDMIGDFSQFAWWHTKADNLRIISRDSLDITLRVTSGMLKDLLQEP